MEEREWEILMEMLPKTQLEVAHLAKALALKLARRKTFKAFQL
jgi:hypothetical protein